MNARERILNKIREATQLLPEKEPMPDADEIASIRSTLMPESNDLSKWVTQFQKRWTGVNGLIVSSEDELVELLKTLEAKLGYVAPGISTDALNDSFTIESTFVRERVDEYHFGITKASCGLVETGTIALTDRDTHSRLSALAPWIHVAALRKEDLYPSIAEALANIEYDPSIVFITGPSKTADIEGVLIQGVHGPGVQICWLV